MASSIRSRGVLGPVGDRPLKGNITKSLGDGKRGCAPPGAEQFKGAAFDLAVGMEEAKRNALRRFYGSGDLHFVTFSCYRRRPYLGTVCARNRFVKILDEVRTRHGFALLGYVLMPEHVHLLMGEPEHGNPSKVLQVVKQKVSPGAPR